MHRPLHLDLGIRITARSSSCSIDYTQEMCGLVLLSEYVGGSYPDHVDSYVQPNSDVGTVTGNVKCRKRLRGLLRYYYRITVKQREDQSPVGRFHLHGSQSSALELSRFHTKQASSP